MNLSIHLEYADLGLTLRASAEGRLPRFHGTTLRGALGYALKRTVCIVRHGDCSRCMLRARCAFPTLFEGVAPEHRTFMRKYQNVPQPMLPRVALDSREGASPGDAIEFGVRLFGPAIDFYPYIVYAVMQMGERGLGADRIPCELVGIAGLQTLVDRDGISGVLPPPTRYSLDFDRGLSGQDATPCRIRCRMETPLRLQTNGLRNRSPTLADIVRAAARRVRILAHFYGREGEIDLGGLIAAADRAVPACTSTRVHSIRRRSVRQGIQMELDGIVGELEYAEVERRLARFLELASECHIGKATSFGYGRMSVEVMPT